VSASRGNDALGRGTYNAPFHTITYAIGATKPAEWDVVELESGIYSAGETWPISVDNHYSLIGTGARLVAPTGAGRGVRLNNGFMKNVSVSGFTYDCIFVDDPTASGGIEGVSASSCLEGVYSTGNLSVVNSTLSHNADTGIMVVSAGTSNLTVYGSTLDSNGAEGINFSGNRIDIAATNISNSTYCVLVSRADTEVNLTYNDTAPSNFSCSSYGILDTWMPATFTYYVYAPFILFNGMHPPTGYLKGPLDNPPLYKITSANSGIGF
jgi:hypothetical protein